MHKIAIFASGSGTNAENIIKYFQNSSKIETVLVLSNNKNAFVLERAAKLGIESTVFNKPTFTDTDNIVHLLKTKGVDYIVLAGFLLRIPQNIVDLFPNKIVNIHPALLPKFGGKGMYGDFVHKAVKEAQETETGITIHYVNEHYDDGHIIFQKKVALSETDTPDQIAEKVHTLEYEYFPKVIEDILS